MKVDFKFNNGDKVKDVVSGFSGIIDCVSLWINGCRRYSVQPMMKKGETTKPDSLWMDEESLRLMKGGVKDKVKPTKTGGPSFSSNNARP